ncbi:LapA family protein [Novosphingobium sp. FSY-8]|uniref:LapA family protein n=1 Tax=Novosphingobium ovatum TaxID=1908523 RepID=A0ABW9XBI2_9SPHN|nr:LapA family protein [Novosphingobium ovatum]NBC35894.1 LapA family protein [Novosphingobium ovatum]
MDIIRTIIWVLIAVVVSAFVAMNWQLASVNVWPLDSGYLHLDWPVGFVALAFFLAGLVPMWIRAKAIGWRLKRRIATLENTIRASTPTPPLATKTQLDAEQAGHRTEK